MAAHKSEMDVDDFFRNLFPGDYDTEFLTQQYTDESNTMGSCQARIALRSKDDFQKWLKEHQQMTGVTYRLRRTQCCKGKYSLFKADYRCHHNTLAHLNKSKQPAKKHTMCPANLSVTIKAVFENTRSTDPFLPRYPAVVTLNHTHNHGIHAMEAIRHKDPSEEVRQKFIELFKQDCTPTQALKEHKNRLMEEHPSNYAMYVADRSCCPDLNWVFRLYHKYYPPKSSTKRTHAMMKPEPTVNLENIENLESNVQIKDDEENLSLANVIPMMEGSDEDLSGASEILFVDSMGNVLQKCKPSDLSDQFWLSYTGEVPNDNPVEEMRLDEQAVQLLQNEEQVLVHEAQRLQEEQGQEENETQEEQHQEDSEHVTEEQGQELQEEEQLGVEISASVGCDVQRQRFHLALLEDLFGSIMASVGQHYAKYPDEFDNAIRTAHSTFEGIVTDSALINAVANFGKHAADLTNSAENGVDTDASYRKRKLSEDNVMPYTKSPQVDHGVREHCYADMSTDMRPT